MGEHEREFLERAVEAGYFEVPRRTTLVELAEEHDVTSREASELMRRGVDAALRECLDASE